MYIALKLATLLLLTSTFLYEPTPRRPRNVSSMSYTCIGGGLSIPPGYACPQ